MANTMYSSDSSSDDDLFYSDKNKKSPYSKEGLRTTTVQKALNENDDDANNHESISFDVAAATSKAVKEWPEPKQVNYNKDNSDAGACSIAPITYETESSPDVDVARVVQNESCLPPWKKSKYEFPFQSDNEDEVNKKLDFLHQNNQTTNKENVELEEINRSFNRSNSSRDYLELKRYVERLMETLRARRDQLTTQASLPSATVTESCSGGNVDIGTNTAPAIITPSQLHSSHTHTNPSDINGGNIVFQRLNRDWLRPSRQPQPAIEENNADAIAEAETEDEEESMYFNEMEVASVSDIPENPIEDPDSSTSLFTTESLSDSGDMINPESNTMSQRNNNNAVAVSQEQFHRQYLVSQSRKRSRCRLCQLPAPFQFLFCSRCFRNRRNWLPPRPRPNKGNKGQRQSAAMGQSQTQIAMQSSSLFLPEPEDNSGLRTVILPQIPTRRPIILPQLFGRRTLTNEEIDKQMETLQRYIRASKHGLENRLENSSENPASTSSDYNLSEINVKETNEENAQMVKNEGAFNLATESNQDCIKNNEIDDKKNICHVCCINEKNAAFVHNKTAHLYSCFSCADKILKKDGKCPVCRDRILRVVKILDV